MAKYVDLIAWDDCPHLKPPHISEEELAEFERSLAPHQRQARRTGRPALGAGAIYPVDEDSIFIDPIPIPPWWERAYALDVGWNVTAAVFGARDPETDIIYLVGEYYGRHAEPIVHVHAIRSAMPYELEGAIDPAASGSSQRDGRKLREEYEALGLQLRSAENAVEAGIHQCLTRYQSGKLKVFNTLPNFRKEFRLYRREVKEGPTGTRSVIVKSNDHLMDGKRYLVNTKGIWRQAPATSKTAATVAYGEF